MISVMTKDAFVDMAAMAAAEELERLLSARPEEGIDQDTVEVIEKILLVYAGETIERIASQLYGEGTQDEDVHPFN